MSLSLAEEITHALVNYLPYVIFIFVAFQSSYKCSKKTLILMIAISSALHILLLLIPHYRKEYSSQALSISLTLISLIFYIAVVDITFFHALFRILIVNNIANFIVVASKCLEGLLFPSLACELPHWSYSLCMILIQAVILIPIGLFFNSQLNRAEQSVLSSKMWCFLSVVPATFFIIWYYVFYYSSNIPSLYMALDPKHTIFQFFILCGQLLIYSCVINLIHNYNNLIQLKEENRQLNIQTLQYQNIQKQIHDVSIMKHDLRHHLMVICSFAENERYDDLKNYLRHDIEQLTNDASILYCRNAPLNMLLGYYSQLCKNQSIEFEIKLNIPNELPLPDNEIAVLFGNLLENSYDACCALETNPKKIIFHGQCKQEQIVFTIDNTFSNDIKWHFSHRFNSTKHEGQGLGTESAQNIVRMHHGFIDFHVEGQMFCVSILLPQNRLLPH